MASLTPIVGTNAATCHLYFFELLKRLNFDLKYALEWLLVFFCLGYWICSSPLIVFVHKCNLLDFITGIYCHAFVWLVVSPLLLQGPAKSHKRKYTVYCSAVQQDGSRRRQLFCQSMFFTYLGQQFCWKNLFFL